MGIKLASLGTVLRLVHIMFATGAIVSATLAIVADYEYFIRFENAVKLLQFQFLVDQNSYYAILDESTVFELALDMALYQYVNQSLSYQDQQVQWKEAVHLYERSVNTLELSSYIIVVLCTIGSIVYLMISLYQGFQDKTSRGIIPNFTKAAYVRSDSNDTMCMFLALAPMTLCPFLSKADFLYGLSSALFLLASKLLMTSTVTTEKHVWKLKSPFNCSISGDYYGYFCQMLEAKICAVVLEFLAGFLSWILAMLYIYLQKMDYLAKLEAYNTAGEEVGVRPEPELTFNTFKSVIQGNSVRTSTPYPITIAPALTSRSIAIANNTGRHVRFGIRDTPM